MRLLKDSVETLEVDEACGMSFLKLAMLSALSALKKRLYQYSEKLIFIFGCVLGKIKRDLI